MEEYMYRDIGYEKYHGRYMITSNQDLLYLKLRTPENLHLGHKGYLKLSTLKKKIDTALDQ